MRHSNIAFLSDYERVVEKYNMPLTPEVHTHVTAHETFGICRECGRSIAGGHESMKCLLCRTSSEEWRDVD